MPILSSGSNVTLAVAAGQMLTVECNASAEYIFENPVGTRVGDYACRNVFGPFTAAASVKLTSSTGSLFYELATAESFNSGFTQCLWANRPASASLYDRILVTDYGVPGLRMVWDGTRWMPDGVQVLARGSVSLPCPTDTTEDTLVTVAVPANLLGINGRLEIVTRTFNTNSANTKTLRVRWSGGAGTAALTYSATTGSNMTTRTLIANRGAANTQFTQGDILGGAASVAITSVDTTAATSVVITGQKALGTETLQLDDYSVLVYP